MKTLWANAFKVIFHGHKAIPHEQIVEMRKAYYFGALDLLNFQLRTVGKSSGKEEEEAKTLAGIYNEIHGFFETQKKEQTK